ncbi:MAG TPA: hypothetical protein VGD54_20195 [Steroidobacteraceae bacterium]
MPIQKPKRAALVQYAEFLLLKRMQESRIEFLIVGGTAARAYGLEVVPNDLDLIVEYQRERWERILVLADEVDPQPSGVGSLTREPNSFPAQLHANLGRGVDVLSGFRHASFSELYPRRREAIIKVDLLDDALPFPVADLNDLIESWRERGEPRDAELISAAESLAR